MYRVKQYPVTDSNTIQLIIMTTIKLYEKAYYEISELSSIPQMFPFLFAVSHEMLYNSDQFSLNNFGGKVVLMDE